jgi:hypothetical protein
MNSLSLPTLCVRQISPCRLGQVTISENVALLELLHHRTQIEAFQSFYPMLPNAGQLFKLSLMEPIVKILGPLPGTTMLLGKTSHVLKNGLLAPIFFLLQRLISVYSCRLLSLTSMSWVNFLLGVLFTM